MKITPLEIRQKTFEKVFRGLDKDEVNAFLVTLSQEWEKLLDENKELRIKLQASEKEVEKLREVENSLFKTLKTAEDTGANMIDQANKTAELHMRETQMKAEAILNDAKGKAKDLVEEAELKAKHTLDDMEDQIRAMAQAYRTLENIKEDLTADIKSFANDALEKVDRVRSHVKRFDVEEKLLQVKRDALEGSARHTRIYEHLSDISEEDKPEKKTQNNDDEVTVSEDNNERKPNNHHNNNQKTTSSSFFDEIE